tara:strand:+ start:317 stop:1522 length:1206 start_codon:yes stop_codon:yes gene_type:complete
MQNVQNAMNVGRNIVQSNKKVFYILSIAMGFFVLVLIFTQLGRYRKSLKEYVLVNNVHSGEQGVKILNRFIPKSTKGYATTYVVWLKVNDYDYDITRAKHIFHVGDRDMNITGPGVWFSPRANNIIMKFSLEDENLQPRFTDGKFGKAKANQVCKFPYRVNDWTMLNMVKPSNIEKNAMIRSCEETADTNSKYGYCATDVNSSGIVKPKNFGSCGPNTMDVNKNPGLLNYEMCDVNNIPVNRWFLLSISIEEESVEIGIDGRLVKTCSLSSRPIYNQGDLYVSIDGGFKGMLSSFRIFPYTIPPARLQKLYRNGPDQIRDPVEAGYRIAQNIAGRIPKQLDPRQITLSNLKKTLNSRLNQLADKIGSNLGDENDKKKYKKTLKKLKEVEEELKRCRAKSTQ